MDNWFPWVITSPFGEEARVLKSLFSIDSQGFDEKESTRTDKTQAAI
jgi:hypothetical protein